MFKHLKQTFLRVCVALIAAAALNVTAPFSAYAQNTSGKGTVEGIITDSNGPVPGAAVMIKDKTGAVISGMDGDYTLSGLEMNDVIVVTILGYKDAQAVWTGQQKLNFTLEVSTEFLDEVVVTALGIKREEKTLSYNVQKVDSDKLTTVKDANFVNSLVGKVAGVQINSGASGPGSTTRVVMRGMKSIEKNNTVLYVIDGVPMYNKSFGGSGGTMSSMVSSESAADINPEDIESVNMLTGPSAAALYGSEAANGVIIINTKKGAEGTTKVTVSNNTTFSRAYMMPDMQDRYGRSGGYNSWGAQLPESYSYDPRKFFNTGTDVINSVAVSTGNKNSQTYISATTTNSKGIVPESKYDRYNFTARNTTKFAKDKLVLDFGASFIIQKDHNLVSQGTYFNPLPGLYLFPRGDDFNEVRLYERWNPVTGVKTQYWPYSEGSHNIQNPYWVQNRNNRDMNKRRYMYNASLQYIPFKWLNITGRARLDESTYRQTTKYYATTLTTFAGENGGYMLDNMTDRSFYGDIIANVDKAWGDWRLIVNAGASINDQRYEMNRAAGDLILPNHFATNNLNTSVNYKGNQEGWHDQTQAVFASVETGWNNMLFLTLTGRNDWASQLAYTDNKSYFYWSAGLSAVISNMVEMPSWLTFMKMRGSYSQVASPFDRFLSNPSYKYNDQTHNWGKNDTYPAYNLKPEDTRSWELGLNVRFLESLSLDVTYYRSNTYNQTIYAPLSASSGYKNFVAQTGNIQNQGVELALGYDNKWGDFSWSSNFTYTFNQNKINELAHGKDWLGASNVAPQVILREGGSLSDIYIKHRVARDLNGNVAVDNNGNIRVEEVEAYKAGQLAPKGNFGWSNTFGFKGISLGVVLTARVGGLVYSATQGILDYYGVSEASASMRDAGGIPVNYGKLGAKEYYTTISTAQGGYDAFYLYSATNVRLQELALNYTFPKKWFNDKLNLTLGVVGRNLAMIYCKAPFDPELSAATGNNYYQGVDYFMLPSTRNFGFNVKLQF